MGQKLKKLLTTEELATVMRSTQYAHYTSEDVTRSIWSALERMGFTGGKVLEPGMGTGNFPITAPETVAPFVAYTGLEMDHLTAAIGKQLVQGGLVLRADYTKQKLPKDHFDVAIGNPPFASTVVSADPEYRKHRFMLHDYFFAKTIDRVRPGGLLAFVTSAGTLNKGSEAARRYIADRADLVGAIRLPNTAFKQNAGTDVVTDIIFLRKRLPGEEPSGPAWMGLEEVDLRRADGSMGKAFINEYFETHPEMVLGRHALTGSMYRADTYTVEPDGDLAEQLKKAIKNLPSGILKPYEAVRDQEMTVEAYDRDLDPENRKEGGLYVKDGKVMVTRSGAGQPLLATEKLSPKETAWVKDAIELRDALKLALRDQLTNGDWKASLKALDDAYHAFVKKHGQINEFTETERTQRFYTDEDGREIALKPDQDAPEGFDAQERTITTRRYKNKKLLALDVESPLLIALEVEGDDGTFHPTKNLKQRSIQPPAPPRIESTHDALVVSLSRKGFLNIEHVAELANVPVEKAIKDLGDRIYRNPIDGEWTMADAYLSGDVVTALEEAEAAARVDPTYRRNVEALRKVQPVPLTPRDITVSLGMAWVKPALINQFAREVLSSPQVKAEYEQNSGQWLVKGAERSKYQRAKDSEFSHADRSAPELLEAILNNREIKVTRTVKEEGRTRTYTDTEATTAVNEIAKRMRARFSTWVWEDADRAEAVAKEYNALRNRIVPRVFDGDFVDPPGLALMFKPDANGNGGLHRHQKRAIWRQIQTGDTYLAHAVGAGKTLEMIVGAMEQKRLGLISKPMFTVPNHMLGQFATEFLETYPAANIMVADEESFVGEKRRQFVAAATVNAPDAIIITHSALSLLRVKPETMQAVTADMIADLEAAILHVGDQDRITRKKLENQLEKLTQRIEGKTDDTKKDDVVFFEDMGVDMLYVDEAHEFRKLDFITNRQNVKGISPDGSAKALDLYAKVRFLHQQRPGRSHVFASGTPVTNTMGELYTVQKFMDYDAMREAGLHHFDAWASEYGEVVTEYERNAAGQYRPVERFAKFNNIPELMMQIRERMDVLTSSQLGQLVKRPNIIGGQPQMVVTEASEDLSAYMMSVLSPRIEASLKWKPSPDQPHNPDPMLAIIGDARLAVIDMRFVDPAAPSDPTSKLNLMIDQIIDKHGEFADVELYETNREGQPTKKLKGATQIVFSPIGFGEAVAKRRGFDARAWINKRLRDAGIPMEEVAWIGDYKTNRKRKALFREMRAGHVRVLFGSPANMGTGVNVQNRLRWLHFLSPPWYPSDVEQPHGRILRQGNLNPEVGISWYVTEGTYDATGWGMVARKAKFIEQVMSGDKSQRSAEDLSEVSQYAMASALASGDDRAIRVAELEADIGRLRNLQGDHERMVHRARDDAWSANNQITGDTDRLARANAAVEVLGDETVRSDNLTLTLNGKPVAAPDRTALAEQLMRTVRDAVPSAARIAMRDGFEQEIGLVNGKFPIVISARPSIGSKVRVDMDVAIGDLKQTVFENEALEDLPTTPSAALGITTRLMNAINGVRDIPARLEARIEENRERLASAEKRRVAPWPQERELYEKVAELARLQQEMAAESIAATQTQQQTPTDQTQPPPEGAQSAPEPGARASGPSETSLGVNDLRRAIDRIIRGWEGDAPIVKTIQAATDLPAAAKRFDGWFDAEGWYDGKNTIYLVADNLPNTTRAEQVLAHEAFGHYGVEGIVSQSAWAQIVADAARIRTMKNLSPEMKGAVDSAVRRYGNENPVQFARELLAVMAERGLRSSILGRLLAAVRRWARALGFKVDRWTEDELRAIVAAGIRSVERGGGTGPRGGRGSAFSEAAPVFYSALAEAVERGAGSPKKGDAAAWSGWLDGAQRRGEIKKAEREWLGVDSWLAGRGTTTREELAEFVRANQVQVREVVLGGQASLDRKVSDELNLWMEYAEIDPDDTESHTGWKRIAMRLRRESKEAGEDGDAREAANLGAMALEAERHAKELKEGKSSVPVRYESIQTPGGTNYRELLLTLPTEKIPDDGKTRYSHEQIQAAMDELALAPTDEEAEAVAARIREMRAANREAGPPPEMRERQSQFIASHFGEPNILAHVRFNERKDMDGNRVLFIEEIQSDWHQAGRKSGYGQRTVDGLITGVPDAPFKGTDEWAMLAFKRMARWAADNGFDRIAWTTGDQQAERYDLSKQVEMVRVSKNGDGSRYVRIYLKDSAERPVFDVLSDGSIEPASSSSEPFRGKTLDEVLGKEMAEKVMAVNGKQDFTDADLKLGGAGMSGFYDKILPSAVKKWAKPFGAAPAMDLVAVSLNPTDAKTDYAKVHTLDITDAMREAVREGLPAFSLRDPGGTVDRLGAALANPKQIAKDKFADMEPALLGLLTLDQLADVSKNFAPQVKRYAKAVLQMQTRRNQLQEKSGTLAEEWQDWQAKNRKDAEDMVGVMHDATIAGTDPAEDFVTGVFALHTGEAMSLADPKAIHKRITDMSRAAREAGKEDVIERLRADRKRLMKEAKVEEARVAAYPALQARFARLPEDAQKLYRKVRDEYRDRSEATQLALLERIGGLQIPGKEKAKLSDQVRTMFESARVHAPYFPLARFGEYWLSATMMVDGKPETSFHLAETKADRDRIETELKADGWTIKARGVKLDNVKAVDGASGSFVANVIQQLRVAGVDDQIQDEVYQLYLRTLPDLSVRKNFIHRKKTAGYSNDALRAFAAHMNHGAHQLARLENSPFLEAEVEDLRKAAKAAAEDEGGAGDKMARAYNELTKRHEWVMNPQDAGWVQKVSSINFMWYLGVSPAAALINLLQTWNVSYPVLASKFGWGKALSEVNKAMAATIRTGGNIAKTAANDAERQALQALQDMGAIDKTLAHDLAGIGDTESTNFNPVQRKVMKFVSFLFHKAEVVNREATGLAAFRMAMAEGQTFQQAVDLAADVIHQTHFNYSNANRARFMQGNAAKVIFAFKQYSQNMTYFLWRQFYQSIKGATPEEKSQARKALLGTLGMTSIYSGVLGLPLTSVMFGIANAMAAAFGDDDEPFDAETEFRNWLADTLGPDLGRVAQVGAVQGGLTALGLPAPSISERVSLNNLWFRDPQMELEGRDLYNYWLEQVAGPVGGIFASAFTGASMFAEGLEKGDPSFLWRGVEASIPKAIKDTLKGVRYATNGVNTLRGDPLIEDMGLMESITTGFIQASGFSPAAVSEAYEVNRAVKGYEKQIEDRRSSLLDAYALAMTQRDTETLREVMGKIKAFNRKHRGMAITTDTIRSSLASRRQYSEQAVNGIVVSRRIPEAREAGRFFAGE
ncbi:MAG: PLxRFG domain-containing protein [Elusimicrobiales bacterium]